MADIDLANLTNGISANDGTGVFDLLFQKVELHIQEQHDCGRITGTDFASVYLGSMQSVLTESIKFMMTEQEADKKADLLSEQIESENKNNEPGGVIDLQKQKLQEEIDLVIANTAASYEQIKASVQDTLRKNLMNSKQVLKVDRETVLLTSQNSELLATGPLERLKLTQETAVLAAREAEELADTIRKDAMHIEELLKIVEEVDLLQSNDLKTIQETAVLAAREAEELAGTIRKDLESTQKITLMAAQTQGFASDTKQKVLKQMLEGYAVNLSIAGIGNVPEACQDPAIDQLVQNILDDLQTRTVEVTEVVIQSTAQVPDVGENVPGDPAV